MTEAVFSAAAIVAVAVWVGSIVFQSFVVAPTIFTRLAPDHAGALLRALFPRFFTLGLVCGGLALGALLALGLLGGWSRVDALALLLLPVMTTANAFSLRLVPRINAARDAGVAAERRFKRLHGLSVALTVGVLVGGVLVLASMGAGVPAVDGR